MRGVLFVSKSPYYALSGPDGRYAIEDLPAGRYRLRLWHERLGYAREVEPREIEISPGSVLRVSHELPSPAGRRP